MTMLDLVRNLAISYGAFFPDRIIKKIGNYTLYERVGGGTIWKRNYSNEYLSEKNDRPDAA